MMCSCTSDIGMEDVQWYREDVEVDSSSSNSNSLTVPVTTDNQRETYTCAISGKCGNQEKNITIAATGKYK